MAGAVAGLFGLLVGRGRSVGRRLAAVAATGIAVLGTFLLVGMLWEQRGLYDPRQSPGLDGVLLPAIALAAVLAVAAGAPVPGLDDKGPCRNKWRVWAPHRGCPGVAQEYWWSFIQAAGGVQRACPKP